MNIKQLHFGLLLTLLLPFWTHAQVFPMNAGQPHWTVTYYTVVAMGTFTVQPLGDSSLNGVNYTKYLMRTQQPILVHNIGNKTYYRSEQDSYKEDHLMYDYDLVKGDTVFIKIFDEPKPYMFVVHQVDSVFALHWRKRISVLYGPRKDSLPFADIWTEGIGSKTHPLYPFACFNYRCEESYEMTCYDSAGVPVIGSAACATGIKPEQFLLSNTRLYPNPAADVVNITFDAPLNSRLQIALYDISGKKVLEQQALPALERNIRINVSGIAAGIYTCRITDTEGQQANRKLVISR